MFEKMLADLGTPLVINVRAFADRFQPHKNVDHFFVIIITKNRQKRQALFFTCVGGPALARGMWWEKGISGLRPPLYNTYGKYFLSSLLRQSRALPLSEAICLKQFGLSFHVHQQ
jgi:hypothetical protein